MVVLLGRCDDDDDIADRSLKRTTEVRERRGTVTADEARTAALATLVVAVWTGLPALELCCHLLSNIRTPQRSQYTAS